MYVDLTEEEEKKVLATLDPLGALANTDFEKFDDLIEDISFENVDLNTMLNDVIGGNRHHPIPEENEPINEDKSAQTPNKCPSCGFEW